MTTFDLQLHRTLVLGSEYSGASTTWEDLASRMTILDCPGRQIATLSEVDTTAEHQAVYDALIQADAVLAFAIIAPHLAQASFLMDAVPDSAPNPVRIN